MHIVSPQDVLASLELILCIETERAKVIDAVKARDSAVARLSDAYRLLEEKSKTIERLQSELTVAVDANVNNDAMSRQTRSPARAVEFGSLRQEISTLEGTIKALKTDIAMLKKRNEELSIIEKDLPPRYGDCTAVSFRR